MMRLTLILGLVCIVSVFADDTPTTTNVPETTFDQDKNWEDAKSLYDFHVNDLHGNEVKLEKYRGHVVLIVNVASKCGLTETNYKELQQLYEKYGQEKGLRILAFPSNDFAGQEPGTPEEILEFVKQYNVTFDMMEKVHVNGDEAHPLYKWLKNQSNGKGFIVNDVKWNFSKFLLDKEGHVVDRFAPTTSPLSIEKSLEKLF